MGGISHDPTVDVLLPKQVDAEPEIFSNDQLRRIKGEIVTEIEDLGFHLHAFAGLRRHEVVGLNWENVDFANEQMKIHGKGGNFPLVPLHPELAVVLKAY